MTSMNGSEFGGHLGSTAGQVQPSTGAADGSDRSVRDTPTSNRRNAAIAGVVLGLIPVLSIVGLIVSIVAARGLRRANESPTLAVVGICVSAAVFITTVVVALLRIA
ncbi:hypothetical protein ELQ90_01420 [Labedella phragmitis]|uniref:DUF4190 domain-containing protein n=1 Tax=Labedella phragmitis TaxID=2498849 RepID=A0A444PXU8_9MICO|nr:hypothetical protein [Labedella phragmitis]RWZ52637.1 hypothetical protein ELQ90_01420 [Labedella phragmitis]